MDTDHDGIPDAADDDDDNDGIPDRDDPDDNGDGIADMFQAGVEQRMAYRTN